MKKLIGLVAWVLVTVAAAAVGASASANAPEFYQQLSRPAWAPPAWLFGPVWTVLYLLMAVAAWLVWSERGFRGAKVALSLFLIQLAVNAIWSWMFFAWQFGSWSFVDIMLLIGLVIATAIAFWRIRPLAAILLLPYAVWISFAAALNFVLWQSNPKLLAAFLG